MTPEDQAVPCPECGGYGGLRIDAGQIEKLRETAGDRLVGNWLTCAHCSGTGAHTEPAPAPEPLPDPHARFRMDDGETRPLHVIDGELHVMYPNSPITAEHMGLFDPQNEAEWQTFKKTAVVHALRVVGPFTVETRSGANQVRGVHPITGEPVLMPERALHHCQDGWLCIDARGHPYAVADEHFQLLYAPHDPATSA